MNLAKLLLEISHPASRMLALTSDLDGIPVTFNRANSLTGLDPLDAVRAALAIGESPQRKFSPIELYFLRPSSSSLLTGGIAQCSKAETV